MKNDFGGHDNHHYHNVYGYVGSGPHVCATLADHEDYFYENKLVTTGTDVGSLQCKTPKTVIRNNTYFTPTGKINECGMDLAKLQKGGGDPGSTVSKIPADDTIIGWARELLATSAQ